jgi:hypothetical protein
MRSTPAWIIFEPRSDVNFGDVKSGKKAQVQLFERTAIATPERPAITSCQFARKRYLLRAVKHKGQLRQLGFQRSSAFVNDVRYRQGRRFRKARDRRAVEQISTYGKHLFQDRSTGTPGRATRNRAITVADIAVASNVCRSAHYESTTTSRTNHGDKRLTVFAAFDAARI